MPCFQFSRNQKGQKSGWQAYMEHEKMGEKTFDPPPALPTAGGSE